MFDTTVSDLAIFETNNPNSSNGPDVVLYRSSASPADADDLGRIAFRGRNDNRGQRRFQSTSNNYQNNSNNFNNERPNRSYNRFDNKPKFNRKPPPKDAVDPSKGNNFYDRFGGQADIVTAPVNKVIEL